jgi:hypothetical protein
MARVWLDSKGAPGGGERRNSSHEGESDADLHHGEMTTEKS